jgi:hypothetical protein
MFDLYDLNNSGYIDATDYDRVGEGFAAGAGSAPGRQDFENIRATCLGFWRWMRPRRPRRSGKSTVRRWQPPPRRDTPLNARHSEPRTLRTA